MSKFFTILIFFYVLIIHSQNHSITGVVFDDKEKPLESANINSKPLTEKETLNLLLLIITRMHN